MSTATPMPEARPTPPALDAPPAPAPVVVDGGAPAEPAGPAAIAPTPARTEADREVVRAALLAAIVLALLAGVYASPLRGWFDGAGIARAAARIDGLGLLGPVVFLPLCAVLVAVGIPRIFLAAVAGATFGFAFGTLLAWAGTVVGCLLAFGVARHLGRGFLARRLEGREGRLRGALQLLERHGVAGNLLIRAAPVGNCLVVNLLMAVSPISRRDFLVGTAIGVAPEALIYALFGSSARGHFVARIATGVLLLLSLSLVYWVVSRRSALARRIAAAAAGSARDERPAATSAALPDPATAAAPLDTLTPSNDPEEPR